MFLPKFRRLEGHPFRRSSRDFELLKTEQARLESFSLEPPWSLGFITPEKLAQAGFFYLQDGDKVNDQFLNFNNFNLLTRLTSFLNRFSAHFVVVSQENGNKATILRPNIGNTSQNVRLFVISPLVMSLCKKKVTTKQVLVVDRMCVDLTLILQRVYQFKLVKSLNDSKILCTILNFCIL